MSTVTARAETGTRTIRNPVLRGVRPDPSIVRGGGAYYLAILTRACHQGVTVHHDDGTSRRVGTHADRRPARHLLGGNGTQRYDGARRHLLGYPPSSSKEPTWATPLPHPLARHPGGRPPTARIRTVPTTDTPTSTMPSTGSLKG